MNLSLIGGDKFSGSVKIRFLNYKIQEKLPAGVIFKAGKENIMNIYLKNFKKQQIRMGNSKFNDMSLEQVKTVCEQLTKGGLEEIMSQAGKMYQDDLLATIKEKVETTTNGNLGSLGGAGLGVKLNEAKGELAQVNLLLERVEKILGNYLDVINRDEKYFEYAYLFTLLKKFDPKGEGKYQVSKELLPYVNNKIIPEEDIQRITANATRNMKLLGGYIDQLQDLKKSIESQGSEESKKLESLSGDDKGNIITPQQLAGKLRGCFSAISGSLGETIAVMAIEELAEQLKNVDSELYTTTVKQLLGENFSLVATNLNEQEKYKKNGKGTLLDSKQDYVVKLENLGGTLGKSAGSIYLTVSHKNLQNKNNITFSTENWLKGKLSVSYPLGNVLAALYNVNGVRYFSQHLSGLLLPVNAAGVSGDINSEYLGNSNIKAAASAWDNTFIPNAKRAIFMAGFIGNFQNTKNGNINMANMLCVNGRFVSMYSLLEDVLNESLVVKEGTGWFGKKQYGTFPSYAEGREAIADKYRNEHGYPRSGYAGSEAKKHAETFFNRKVGMLIDLGKLTSIF